MTFLPLTGKLPDSLATPPACIIYYCVEAHELAPAIEIAGPIGPSPVAMTHSRVSYTLDSTLETVNSAEATASEMASDAGFTDDDVMKIAMAVREAAVNAVLHGNAYDPGKKVTLDFERTGDDLVITIRDQGKGIDLKSIPDPLAPENLLKTSGRGIFLIRSFMDEVEINPSQAGTEIKLIKHVHGPAAGGKEASQ